MNPPEAIQSGTPTAPVVELWSPSRLEDGGSLIWRCGPMRIYARRRDQDWSLASRTVDDTVDEEDGQAITSTDWTNWPLGRDEAIMRFRPTMPDRPLVVKPEAPLMIPVSVEVSFFISIPVSVEVLAGSDPDEALSLATYPSVRLSDTWFGSKSEGSLCYALKTPARRKLDKVERREHLAVCPVIVVNESTEPLQCEKINVDGSFLELYLGPEGLWTNPVKVSYQGKEATSKVDFDYSQPKTSRKLVKVAEARERPKRGILRKTFRF